MANPNFIFRYPADMPELSYEVLAAKLDELCDHRRCVSCALEIGTTVKVRRTGEGGVSLRLYGLDIAHITAGYVTFGNADDPHRATAAWLTRVVQDNGIGYGVGRIRRVK